MPRAITRGRSRSDVRLPCAADGSTAIMARTRRSEFRIRI
jgi:hypothetical protein